MKDIALKLGNSFCESKIEGNYIGDLMTGWQLRGIKGAEQRAEEIFISFIRLSKGLWHKKNG